MAADVDVALAELREAIHRATGGRLARDETRQRGGFAEAVLVTDGSMSRWQALWD